MNRAFQRACADQFTKVAICEKDIAKNGKCGCGSHLDMQQYAQFEINLKMFQARTNYKADELV